MKDTHTIRTFCDDCALTLRYDGGTAHFELWVPGEDPEPLATIPALGGELEWTPSGRELLDGSYDEGRGEMLPISYADDLQHLLDSYAALQGDRRRFKLSRKWYVWEVSGEEDLVY